MAKDNFDKSVSYPMDKGYYDKPVEYIDEQQRERDAYCMGLIKQAATTGLLMLNDKVIEEGSKEARHPDAHRVFIDKDAQELLESYYQNGMETYRQMYLVFDKIFGEEENIQVVDPKDNRVIKDNASLKDITPNSCVKVFYRDDNNNKVVLTYPGLKNVIRAIQKLALDGKYHNEYSRKNKIIEEKYKDSPQKMEEAKKHILTPTDMMGDILRVSLSMKRYTDLLKWISHVQTLDGFNINPKRIKDKFFGNDIKRHQEFSEKNFRNMVVYIELDNGAKIEVQGKLISLELVDNLTHPFYEKLRLDKERAEQMELAMSKEQLKTSDEYKLLRRKISSQEYTILALNRWGIEKHNQHDVLDKVWRMEERKRVKGIKIDESKLTPQEKAWVAEGMDPESVRFLQDNFLVRPKQAYTSDELPNIPQKIKNMYRQYHKDLFSARPTEVPEDFVYIFKMYDKSPELQNLFKDASVEEQYIFNKYKKILAPLYRCVIQDNNKLNQAAYAAQKQHAR